MELGGVCVPWSSVLQSMQHLGMLSSQQVEVYSQEGEEELSLACVLVLVNCFCLQGKKVYVWPVFTQVSK